MPFRSETLEDWARGMVASMPAPVRLIARWFPGAGRSRMEKLAKGPGGTLNWIANDDREHIEAYFGSREAWEKLPRHWADFQFREPSREVSLLDHGYNTDMPEGDWTATDLKGAAQFRGGSFQGDSCEPDQPAAFRCALGHDFTMTPRLYLKGGHWCPTCMVHQTSYDENKAANPFFAQVWPDMD